MKQLDIKAVQQKLLNMAIIVDELCTKHNIPLYMISGTMLGAIRHKGFIPWDDDMDFAVSYENYQSLIGVLKSELPSQYRCITYDQSDTFINPWIKVEDMTTKVYDNSLNLPKDKMPGLTIDIFPLVSCKKDECNDIVQKIQRWIRVIRYVYAKSHDKNSRIKNWTKGIVSIVFPISPINICRRVMQLTDSIPPGDHYIIPMDPNYSNRYFPIHWFEPLTRYEFEDKLLYGAAKYDNYLKEVYGNYMVLPPIEKRRIHCDNVFEVD